MDAEVVLRLDRQDLPSAQRVGYPDFAPHSSTHLSFSPRSQEEGISDLFKKLWKLPRRNTRRASPSLLPAHFADSLSPEEDEFGIHVRGFLLDLGQFRGRDNSALCIEAKEEEQRRLAESRQARMKSVSGLEEIEKARISSLTWENRTDCRFCSRRTGFKDSD